MKENRDDLPKPRLSLPSIVKETFSTLIFVVMVTVLFDLVAPRSLVDGQSMEPTFHDADRLVVSRVNYLLGSPSRGDIIVFNAVDPRDAQLGIMLIKRVIGLPGETVQIQDQQVYINDVLLDEPYINEACWVNSCPDRSWVLGEKEFFVMGDNRNHSNDSRVFDAVPFDHIIGEVIFRYWPPSALGIITG